MAEIQASWQKWGGFSLDIKRRTVVGYIATAAAQDPRRVDFVRLAEEAGLTFEMAAAIAQGEMQRLRAGL